MSCESTEARVRLRDAAASLTVMWFTQLVSEHDEVVGFGTFDDAAQDAAIDGGSAIGAVGELSALQENVGSDGWSAVAPGFDGEEVVELGPAVRVLGPHHDQAAARRVRERPRRSESPHSVREPSFGADDEVVRRRRLWLWQWRWSGCIAAMRG